MWQVVAALAVLAGGSEMDAREVGRGGRIFAATDVDELLARPYRDDVPMACTGKCLWAAHPSGWAFAEGVHYYRLTPGGVGFDLRLSTDGQPIEPAEGIARPSHVRQTGDAGGVRVEGAKWISGDDVMAVRLTLENTTDQPVPVEAVLVLPSASVEVQGGQFLWQVHRHGMDIGLLGFSEGFEAVAPAEKRAEPAASSVEGERPVRQEGSQGPDTKSAASGGEVLGSGFGGFKGNFAVWEVPVREAVEDAVLTFRYSRAKTEDAILKIEVDGRVVAERQAFEGTGGWGDSASDFKLVSFGLGRVAPGKVRVRVESLEYGSNVNFDKIGIHPRGTSLSVEDRPTTRLARRVTLPAKGSETLTVLAAAATKADELMALNRAVGSPDLLKDQVEGYNGWLLENVPDFRSDEALTRQYWHRATSVLKKSLFRVGEGRMTRWGIAEGRWNTTWYPNMISYGAGHQIREARWLRDPVYVRDIIATWCANEKDNGVFPSHVQPFEIGQGQYTDWITSTVWDAHCVAPDEARLREWADALKHNVDGWLKTYDADDDGLLLVDSHWWTGMEWQPSFFYFNGYDKDKEDQHLERVDLTAYVYGNAKGLARVLEAIGDAEGAKRYDGIADRIAKATADVMWDEESRFFYSVEPKTHEKAMVKEIIGVYPFYFSMFGKDTPSILGKDTPYAAAWSSILDPEEFWTTWPVASASKKCPAYSQDVTFHGKDVGGCMWNGPTWPHANSIVLSAMAATLREFEESPLKVEDFQRLLRAFTMEQFLKQDLLYPWTGEYLNGDTGEWRTAERDYNHSTYIDVIIADYAGLRPRADETLELRPLLTAETPVFVLDGVRYHGHDVTVAWTPEKKAGKSPDGLTGFRVYVDGKLVHRSAGVPEQVLVELG